MALIADDLEVLEAIVEHGFGPAPDHEARQGERLARELSPHLLEVIEVQMAIAACPDEVARRQIALRGDHVREQCIRCDIERDAEEYVGAALIELARQSA